MSRWALAVAPLLVLACASRGPILDPGVPAKDRQTELERRVVELEKEAVRSRLELDRLRQRVAELAATAGAAQAQAAASAATASAEQTAPPTPLRPELEESDLEEPRATVPGGTFAPPPPGSEVPDYEAALRLLRDGHAAESERALEAFVTAHPSSDLADNAWFWIGESRLVRQDAPGAAQAYRTAIEKYPDGNKVPDALFKLGHCLALEGDEAGAAEVWRETVRRFPGTVAAERARDRLGAKPGS
jgi:tol-pal system protein YbgF